MSLQLSRRQYAEMYGPTVGDQVRLGDTELFIQVEKDLIAEAHERIYAILCYDKTIRRGQAVRKSKCLHNCMLVYLFSNV